jgi:hypothetical protein
MTQDQPTTQGQSDQQQQNDFFSSLSFDAFCGDSSPLGSQVCFRFPHPLNLFEPSMLSDPQIQDTSYLSYPYMPPNHGSPLPRMAAADVFGNHNNINEQRPEGHLQSRKEDGAHYPREPLWPNYNPGYPTQPLRMQSRLPSDNVGRKAPRKANVPHDNSAARSSDCSSSSQGQVMDVYPRKPTTTPSVQHNPAQQVISTQDISAPLQDRYSHFPTTARGRHRNLNSDEDTDDDTDDQSPPRKSIEVRRTSRITQASTIATPTPATHTQLLQGVRRQRPRTQYEYVVPDKLEGIQRALGDDNWTGYVVLVEQKVLEEITQEQFLAQSNEIFQAFDDRTRAKIERQVTNKMVVPAIMRQEK